MKKESEYKTVKYKRMKFIIPTNKTIRDYPVDDYVEQAFKQWGGAPCEIEWGMRALGMKKN